MKKEQNNHTSVHIRKKHNYKLYNVEPTIARKRKRKN